MSKQHKLCNMTIYHSKKQIHLDNVCLNLDMVIMFLAMKLWDQIKDITVLNYLQKDYKIVESDPSKKNAITRLDILLNSIVKTMI